MTGRVIVDINPTVDRWVRRRPAPEKLLRLVALKEAFDPDNVFHLNQNTRPTTS